MNSPFVKERLRQALHFHRRTAKDLAAAIGVEEYTLSRYINGRSQPGPDVLQRIAVALALPTAFFFRPVPDVPAAPVFYRSLAAATKRARARAEARFLWFREIVRYLEEFVELPPPNFPRFPLPRDPAEISWEAIEDMAARTRWFWGMGEGPIADLVKLVESNGGIVARVDLAAHTLDAFSQWCPDADRPYFVLSADKQSAVRSRWDLAHEIGHMVLHRELDQHLFADPATFRLIEEQAHRFAGAFLMPPGPFGMLVRVVTLNALLLQKRVWGVSVAGMLRRARHLGFVSAERAQVLWQNYSRRGWRSGEPLDEELPPERPRLVRQAVELVIREGGVTREQFLVDLPFDREEIQALCSLPISFFREQGLDLRLRPRSGESPSTRVIQFPEAPANGVRSADTGTRPREPHSGQRSTRRREGAATMATSKDVHTVKNSDGSGWVNKAGGDVISKHRTQENAINAAIRQATERRSDHVIHGRNGQIREKNSYGNDPNPPRDKR